MSVCKRVFSVGFGPGLDSMSPARCWCCASHDAGSHDWLPPKNGCPGLRRGRIRWIQFAQSILTVAHQPRACCIRLVLHALVFLLFDLIHIFVVDLYGIQFKIIYFSIPFRLDSRLDSVLTIDLSDHPQTGSSPDKQKSNTGRQQYHQKQNSSKPNSAPLNSGRLNSSRHKNGRMSNARKLSARPNSSGRPASNKFVEF